MACVFGPMKTTPLFSNSSANCLFSEKKPYPGCTWREGEREGGREGGITISWIAQRVTNCKGTLSTVLVTHEA